MVTPSWRRTQGGTAYVERLNEMALVEGSRPHSNRVNSSKERRTSPLLDPENAGGRRLPLLKICRPGSLVNEEISQEWTARITNEFFDAR